MANDANKVKKRNWRTKLLCIRMNKMSKLIACIWFANNDGEEAVKYYIDIFNSAPGDHSAKMGDITKSPKAVEEASGRPGGKQ